jgi:hypothetical protein
MSRERYRQSVLLSTGWLRGNCVLATLVSPLRGSRLFLFIFPPLPRWATLFRPSGTSGELNRFAPKLLQAAGTQVR